MQLSLIDSHCHPQLTAYDGDRDEMIQRSLADGVGLIAMGTNIADSLAGIRLAEAYPGSVWAAIGIHPTDEDADDINFDELKALLHNQQVVGIGETGLDYFRLESDDERQFQHDLFEQHILLAQHKHLPLIIHCRDKNGVFDAYDDTLKLLKRHRAKHFVMHCYSGDWDHAEPFLDLGGLLSFTGIVTFPKSDMLHDVVKRMPLERMMVETDAPFLAPEPHRGKRNEPAWVALVAGKIASLRGIQFADVQSMTMQNTLDFFGLEKGSSTI